jgi:alkaline phosphatase D
MGANDAGADYPMLRESKEEFLRWLDEPADSPRRSRAGVYAAHIFGPAGRRVQIILLDTRSFRSPLRRATPSEPPLLGGPYRPLADPAATMLGDAQWRWLREQLAQPAELRLIASSIQFVSEFSGGEAWANLPLEKQRLLDLLRDTRAAGVLFVSGDRHWAELSRMPGPTGYALHDLTASALTEKHPRGTPPHPTATAPSKKLTTTSMSATSTSTGPPPIRKSRGASSMSTATPNSPTPSALANCSPRRAERPTTCGTRTLPHGASTLV